MTRAVILAGLLLTALLLSGCGSESFTPIRLVDRLTPEGVIAFPLEGEASENAPGLEPLFRMRDRDLLETLDAERNPMGIVKRIKVKRNTLEALYAPSGTELAFDLDLPERPELVFGYGLMEAAFTGRGDGVRFSVVIDRDGNRTEVFTEDLIPSRKANAPHLRYASTDLSAFGGRRVTVHLKTHPMKNRGWDLSFWAHPVIRDRSIPVRRPRVILVSLDTLRADHLGCYGYTRDTSPALNALAAEGVLFERCYTSAPSTLLAHMSLMTACYPSRHGVVNRDFVLHREIPTLAERFRDEGYACAAFTGGGLVNPVFGFSRGFDAYHSAEQPASPRAARILAEKAGAWLERHREDPFFLFLHTYQTHDPYHNDHEEGRAFLSGDRALTKINLMKHLEQRARQNSREGAWDRRIKRDDSAVDVKAPPNAKADSERPTAPLSKRAAKFLALSESERQNVVDLYDGEIRYADRFLIADLVKRLKALDLYDDTLIVVVSDHGEAFYEHGMWLHCIHLYEELLHVPFLMRLPGGGEARRVTTPVSLVDVAPTILAAAGLPPDPLSEAGGIAQGRDLSRLVRGGKLSDRPCFAEARPAREDRAIAVPKVSIVAGRHKLIFNRLEDIEGVRSDFLPTEAVELFDLAEDPDEALSRAREAEAIVKRMMKLLPRYYEAGPAGSKRLGEGLPPELKAQLESLGYL